MTKKIQKVKGKLSNGGRANVNNFLRLQQERMALLEGPIRLGDDPEALHEYRVAVRRVRTTLRFIMHFSSKAEQEHFCGEFRWLAAETSTLRDLDVHLEQICDLHPFLETSLRKALDRYVDFLVQKRRQVREDLLRVLNGQRYRELRQTFAAFLAANDNVVVDVTLAEEMGRRLRRMRKRLLRQGDAITFESSATKFHRLRKTGKKFRYLMELCQELRPIKMQRGTVRHLKRLQDVLGTVQDVEVQQQVLLDFCRESGHEMDAETWMALGCIFCLLSQRRDAAHEKFSEIYGNFAQRCRAEKSGEMFS